MNKSGMTLSAALVMSALLVALAGCEKKEGPVEKAGKEGQGRQVISDSRHLQVQFV